MLLASPFDVPELEWMWHFASQQWHMGPPKPGWVHGWYYSWRHQSHVLWHESSAAAQATVQAEPGGGRDATHAAAASSGCETGLRDGGQRCPAC